MNEEIERYYYTYKKVRIVAQEIKLPFICAGVVLETGLVFLFSLCLDWIMSRRIDFALWPSGD